MPYSRNCQSLWSFAPHYEIQCIIRVEIIGEAVNRILKVDKDFPIENAKQIIGTRNRIIHSYDNISDEVLWTIVCRELPKLKLQVDQLIKQ